MAVVGNDFKDEHIALLKTREINISGLEQKSGKTFRWSGIYSSEDTNVRTTLDTKLNVFADFAPKLNSVQAQNPVIFLANIDPDLQLDVLKVPLKERLLSSNFSYFYGLMSSTI